MALLERLSAFLHCPRRRLIWLAVLLAAAGVLMFRLGPRSLAFPDAMEYADAARGWARGDGMLDRAVWAHQLGMREGVPSPMVRRAVLFPILEGLVFQLAGAGDRTAIAISITCFLLSVLAACLLAGRLLSGSILQGAMIFAVALVCLTDSQQATMAVSGLSEPLFMILVTSAAFLSARKLDTRGCLALGVVIGLAQLTRLNGFLLLAPAVLAQWVHLGRFPLRGTLIIAAGTAPFLLALAVRNWMVIGDFSFVGLNSAILFNGVAGLTEHGIERRLYLPPENPPTLAWILANHPAGFASKLLRGLSLNIPAAVMAAGPVKLGMAALAAGAVWPVLTTAHRAVAVFGAATGLVWVVFFSAGEFEGPRFFVPLAPLAAVLAVAGFDQMRGMADRSDPARRGIAGVIGIFTLGLLLLLPSAIRLATVERSGAPSGGARIAAAVMPLVPREAVVMTDLSWAVAWYADRAAVYLPRSVGEAGAVAARSGATHVLVTALAATDPEMDPSWRALMETGAGKPANWRPLLAEGGLRLYQIQGPPLPR